MSEADIKEYKVPGQNEADAEVKPYCIITKHDWERTLAQAKKSTRRRSALRNAHKAYMILKAEHEGLRARYERAVNALFHAVENGDAT